MKRPPKVLNKIVDKILAYKPKPKGESIMVRAKFTVRHIDHQENTSGWYRKVILEPRYDDSIPEDRRFCAATPSGKIEMVIDNPAALEQFKPGTVFYVDFTEIPKS